MGRHRAVRLLDGDAEDGAMLLERLDAARPLSAVADDGEAMRVLAGLLARLTAVAAPPDLRRLADIAATMLEEAPRAAAALRDPTPAAGAQLRIRRGGAGRRAR